MAVKTLSVIILQLRLFLSGTGLRVYLLYFQEIVQKEACRLIYPNMPSDTLMA